MKRIDNFNLGDIVNRTESNANDVQKEVLKDNQEHILNNSGIPKRYLKAEFKAINKNQDKLIAGLRENFNGKKFEDIRDMLILGDIGTGKTHLTLAMLLKLASVNIYCRYSTEHNLLDLYFQKRYEEFEAFKKVNVLVVDELGKRDLLDWQKIQLEELISYRYNEMLPTIFITNLTSAEFKEFMGDRIASRMRENKVKTILMVGEDLRGKI